MFDIFLYRDYTNKFGKLKKFMKYIATNYFNSENSGTVVHLKEIDSIISDKYHISIAKKSK